jgi:hypothetical protein
MSSTNTSQEDKHFMEAKSLSHEAGSKNMEASSSASRHLETIPALLTFLSESSPLPSRSENEKSCRFLFEDLLNIDCHSSDQHSDCPSQLRTHSKDVDSTDRSRVLTQALFDELALQSPRTEPGCRDPGFFNDPCVCNFPRARSLPSIPAQSRPETDFYEPTRIWQSSQPPPPPRRFYKFWWRGLVRAAYDLERAEQIGNVARSISAARE